MLVSSEERTNSPREVWYDLLEKKIRGNLFPIWSGFIFKRIPTIFLFWPPWKKIREFLLNLIWVNFTKNSHTIIFFWTAWKKYNRIPLKFNRGSFYKEFCMELLFSDLLEKNTEEFLLILILVHFTRNSNGIFFKWKSFVKISPNLKLEIEFHSQKKVVSPKP